MRLDRLLAIVIKLLNQDRVSARDLAEHFEVSVRTIYRDFDAINLSGIPVVAFSGNQGGYGILENYKVDRQFLGLSDLVAICSVLKGVNAVMADQKIDAALDKLTNLVPKDKTAQFQDSTEQMVVDILPWGFSRKQREKLALIQRAISHTQLLQFVYHNSEGKSTDRRIEPMTLLYKGYVWYLFGYCHARRDYRLFRLTRIHKPRLLGQTFVRRSATYQAYLEPETSPLPMVNLRLKFTPHIRFRVEDYYAEAHPRFLRDGSCVVTLAMPENEWLYGFLLSHGQEVEVLEPAHVRRQLQEKAEKIAALYKPDIGVSQRSAILKPKTRQTKKKT